MDLLLPEARQLDADALVALYDTPGPYVRAGAVVSLDGATSYGGGSRPLQAPGDLQVLLALRTVADVVLVGAGTARTEAYGPVRLPAHARRWRSAAARRPDVPLAVVSRSLELPADAAWLQDRPYVITCAAADPARRDRLAAHAEVLVCGDDAVDLEAARDRLAERGHPRVLCEGGPTLLGDLARARLLTEVCATVSPLLAGAAPGLLGGALDAPVPLELAHLLRQGSTLLGRWLLPSATVG